MPTAHGLVEATGLLEAPPVTSTLHTIHPQPPFSFPQSLIFLGRFPPTLGERAVVFEGDIGGKNDGAVLGAARLNGQTVGFRVWADGDTNAPVLNCELHSEAPLTEQTAGAIVDRISAWLGTADDLRPFYALAAADTAFMRVIRQLYGYHQVRFFTPFENTCWAILGQRASISVAQTAKRGLMTRYAGSATVNGKTFLAFPEPADLAAASLADLSDIVSSARKAERLHHIAQAFEQTGPAALNAMSTDDLGAWLRELPGIGPWSEMFILLRGFGRPDAPLQIGAADTFDRELLTAARRVYGAKLTEQGLGEIIERYDGWHGYWGHYLRVAG
jgi:DNA-3-methyladenine glycosylase II